MRIADAPELLLRCASDDGLATESSLQQTNVEYTVLDIYECALRDNTLPLLHADLHARFLASSINQLPQKFLSLDAARPWLVYWILNALDLLHRLNLPSTTQSDLGKNTESTNNGKEYRQLLLRSASTLLRCQHPTFGGFGGNIDQAPHLAPTYASVLALAIMGIKDAWRAIDRSAMLRFLMSVKQPDGSFIMHVGGEVDIRGSYCALTVAHLLNIMTPQLVHNCANFIQRCQTYEGGLGSVPFAEAHGGYTYCGVATMELLTASQQLDLRSLIHWAVKRQMFLEGGFHGRPNKLVDGCYSFWIGGLFPLLNAALSRQSILSNPKDYLFDREALQEYILRCCQTKRGGLRDKPEKSPDHYHTCYTLNGLSMAQNYCIAIDEIPTTTTSTSMLADALNYNVKWSVDESMRLALVDGEDDCLPAIHPVFGVRMERVTKMRQFFCALPQVV